MLRSSDGEPLETSDGEPILCTERKATERKRCTSATIECPEIRHAGVSVPTIKHGVKT